MAIHDLTFSDWDNYTDGDGNAFTLDWTDVAAMTRQFPYPYIEAIRQAVNERFAISDRGVSSSGISIAPIATAVLGNGWVNYVLKQAIQYVRGQGFDGDASAQYWRAYPFCFFDWVKPSAISTTKNLTEGYEEDLMPDLYTGTYMLDGTDDTTNPLPTWTTVQTTMLDDAGIVDATFRTWWLQTGATYISEIQDNMLFAWVDIVLNLKKILSLLTKCLDQRYPGTLFPFRFTPGASDSRILFSSSGRTETDFDDAKTVFDSVSWTRLTGWTTPRQMSTLRSSGFKIERYRNEFTFDIGGTCSRNIEISPAVAFSKPPRYQPYDFDLDRTLVPPLGTTGGPDWVYGVEKSSTAYNSDSISLVSGNFGDCSLQWESGSFGWCGWVIYLYLIFEDFNVTNGFTFR